MKYHFVSCIAIAAELCLASSLSKKAARENCEKYELDLTWETYAPDGFPRSMILINGKSPGPEIHIKEGDCVEVNATFYIYTYVSLIPFFINRW
jgi:hypothetical protein